MTYGKGAVPGITGVALLPFTGNNDILLIIAGSLIALGIAVFAVSVVIARKSRRATN